MMPKYEVRRPRDSDIPEFDRILKTYENNPIVDQFETAAVVTKDDEVKGFGVTRALLEAVLYTDGSVKDKTIVLKELLNRAALDATNLGFNQLYVFVDSPQFAEILISHFNFTPAIGKCLILNLEQ